MLDRKNIKIVRLNKFLDYKNISSFLIIKAYNNMIYELELSKSIKSVYLVFYSWLLYLDNSDFLLG